MEALAEIWKTDGLTPEETLQVQRHLDDVLASPVFSGSKRAQDFLVLVVGHALLGEFDALRERMIGAEMFGRPVGYDTGSDSVVRVKATEVRKKLAQYYLEAPHSAPRIDLPSGSYVPRFCFDSTPSDTLENDPGPPLAASSPPLRLNPIPTAFDESPQIQSSPVQHAGRRTLPARLAQNARRHPAIWAVSLLVAVIALLGIRRYLSGDAAISIHSIAVLPLANNSGVPAQEYIADGMTTELVSDLSHGSSIRVAPVTATTSYKNTAKTPREIAHELGVDGIVQGTVLREGNQVLISIQFTDSQSNTPIWMHNYVRELTTALAWQGEVAQAIAREINAGVTQQGQAKLRANRQADPVAQDLYLHGKYLLESEDCTNAADYFRAALNVNFNDPQTLAALAFCDGHLGETDRVDSRDAFSMQKIEASKAVELDDSLAEGHAELANAAINLNWDWATAGNEFRRALQLSPRSASIHEEYEQYLVRTGRVRETLAELQKSEDIDPFSSRLYHLEGSILYYCRQYDQALALIQKVKTLDIPQPNWHFLLAEIYTEKGSYNEAVAEISRAGSRPQAEGHMGNLYARFGHTDEALALIPPLEDTVKSEGIGRYEIALIYVGLGRKDDAFKWLEEAYKAHDEGLTYLKIDPCLDPLRSDPRFDDLLSRVGLAQ